MNSESENCKVLLEKWLARTVRSQELHYRAADEASGKNYFVSLLGVGGGVAVALNSLYPPTAAIVVPVIGGVAAAFASAAQMVFRWSDKAEAHKAAAVQMGQIRRNVERLLALPELLTRQAPETLHEQISLVLGSAPRIPFDFYDETPSSFEHSSFAQAAQAD